MRNSTREHKHGTIMLQKPCGAFPSLNFPACRRTANVTATPDTATQAAVSVYAANKLDREKRRADPGDSPLEIRRVIAWYAVVAINAAGKTQSAGETLIMNVAKISARVDTQTDVHMSGNNGCGNGSMNEGE